MFSNMWHAGTWLCMLFLWIHTARDATPYQSDFCLDGTCCLFRQGQAAPGAQAAASNAPAAPLAAVSAPNPASNSQSPASSTGLGSLPTGNTASNAAAGPGQAPPGTQAQQPKTIPTTPYVAQSGSSGSQGRAQQTVGNLGARPGNAAAPAAAAQPRTSVSDGLSGELVPSHARLMHTHTMQTAFLMLTVCKPVQGRLCKTWHLL